MTDQVVFGIVNQLAASGWLLHLLAALSYSGLAYWLWKRSGLPEQTEQAPRQLHIPLLLLVVPLLLHGLGLAGMIFRPPFMQLSFALALSLVLWLAVLIYWMEAWRLNIGGLMPFLLPVAGFAALCPAFFTESHRLIHAASTGFQVHFLAAMLAYSLFTLAMLYAVFMGICESALHHHKSSRLLAGLPPLLSMESLLFRFVWVAFLLLSVALLTGAAFSEEVFGRALRFEHKTLFGFISWLIIGVLLIGRHIYGWRGKRAQYFILAGFMSLLLAYIGTRFVLEVLLGRV